MNKNLIIAFLAGMLVAGGVWYIFSRSEIDVLPSPASVLREEDPLADRFQARLETEGSDAATLRAAFPGLAAADFDGVATAEGRYALNDGELMWFGAVAPEAPATTLRDDGFATLYRNVSKRLEIKAKTVADVDAMIATLLSS